MGTNVAVQRNTHRYASTCDWYTPDWLLERVRAFLGDYYDPCPAREGKPIAQNGLAVTWRGRVFCNPPYGRGISAWIQKAMTEPAREVILLVPAYTDTDWFTPLFGHPICFVHGRISFMRPGNQGAYPAPHPSVLVYRGRRTRKFAEAFCDLGPVLIQKRERKPKQPRLLSA